MNDKTRLATMSTELDYILKIVEKELQKCPEGHLMLARHGSKSNIYPFWETEVDGKHIRREIARNRELVRKLARKAFLTEERSRLSVNCKLLANAANRFVDLDEASILACLPKNFDTLPPDYLLNSSPDLHDKRARKAKLHPTFDESIPVNGGLLRVDDCSPEEWGKKAYRQNAKYQEQKKMLLPSGLRVRSKAEGYIFDLYRKHNIYIHYDELIDLTGTWISPDFIAIRSDGKLFYHEHFGLMNNPDYENAYWKKISLYCSNGITPWDNLIITYDGPDGSFDGKLIEAIIESKFVNY